MNKTVTVNLGGTVFHIDDNAYDGLTKYLNSIKSRFSAEQGRDEIMQDIESRIGEMFSDRMKDGRQVITLSDVEEVTRMMGRPEEFAEEGATSQEATATSSEGTPQYKRRMFRNADDRLLGGVCSGIAAYFDVDPVWIRLGFAVFGFLWGAGIWLYIILWIILPKAKTTADKLMMKGEPITISNIEKNVTEELNAVKQQLKDGRGESVIRKIFDAIGEVFKFLFMAIGKIIAAFFLFIGLIVLFALFLAFLGVMHVPGIRFTSLWNHLFLSSAQSFWAYLGILLLIGVPFLMLAYAGAKMIFKIKKSRRVSMIALGLWVAGIILCTAVAINVSSQFAEKENIRRDVPLGKSSMLYLRMDEPDNADKNYEQDYGSDFEWGMGGSRRVVINGVDYASGEVNLDIVKSPSDSFVLSEIFYSYGPTRKDAAELASHISYSFKQVDSTLLFNRFFIVDKNERFRNQRVQLVLRVPVGGKVRLDNSIKRLIYDVNNVQNIYDADMVNRTWQMTDKGLTCLDCTGMESSTGESVSINSDDSDDVKVDNGAMHIKGKNGDKVDIDKHGIHVHSKGKEVVKIDENGIRIHSDSSATKK